MKLNNITVKIKKHAKIIFFMIMLFMLLCLWSNFKEYDRWGDEIMRYQIPKFIFENNRLPTLFDSSIYDELYGFSYAAQPNLPYIIAAIFMKAAYFFGVGENNLLLVARFVNILYGLLFAFFTIKIANELFTNKYIKIIFISIVVLWPELLYMFIYVNTDAMALLGISIVTLYLIRGVKNGWIFKNCLCLAIGNVLIILSYQNAYGMVLISAFIFIASYFQNKITKLEFIEMIKKGLLIMFSVGLCTLWFYIRNIILYGSLTGSNITNALSLKYGSPNMNIAFRAHSAMDKMSSLSGIKNWFSQSLTTFFAWGWYDAFKFNYPHIIYQLIKVSIVLIGVIALIKIITTWKNFCFKKKIVIIGMTIAGLINFGLSFYFSAFCDYVPIGRYWMPSIIIFGMMMTYGIRTIINRLKLSPKIVCIILSSLLITADISVIIFR